MRQLVKKFEETTASRSGRSRTFRTLKNIERVRQSVQDDLSASSKSRA